jgi:poly(3-hydroxybutyrate) depolymerase
MRCERHGLALGPEGTCVLCRKMGSARPPETSPRPASRSRVAPLLLILVLLAAGGASLWRYVLASQTDIAALRPRTAGTLTTKNSAGRSGAYFLPSGYAGRALPLLVAIHGTNGSGGAMVQFFREAAEREKFIVVAPDSRATPDGKDSWEVGDHAGEITPDYLHVKACVAEVLAMPGVRLDPTRVLIAGHSGGGSTAPYVATNEEPYTAFAVLHGGVFASGLGKRSVRGWFSTGKSDGMRGPTGCRRPRAGRREPASRRWNTACIPVGTRSESRS